MSVETESALHNALGGSDMGDTPSHISTSTSLVSTALMKFS